MNRKRKPSDGRRLARTALALALMSALAPAWSADSSGSGSSSASSSAESSADANYDPFSELGVAADSDDDAPAYRDRIIAPERLAPLPADEDEENTASGPPRAVHLELIAHRSRFGGERSVELGAAFGGFWDTDSFGAISADALLFRSDRERDGGDRWRGSATQIGRAHV